MTPQEIFNTAYLGVLSQGGPSLASNGYCAYRGKHNRKCGVGWVISDETAAQWDKLTSPDIECILHDQAEELEPWMLESGDILCQIQTAHDNATKESNRRFLRDFKSRMALVAAKHNLTVPA